eukprot:660505_1
MGNESSDSSCDKYPFGQHAQATSNVDQSVQSQQQQAISSHSKTNPLTKTSKTNNEELNPIKPTNNTQKGAEFVKPALDHVLNHFQISNQMTIKDFEMHKLMGKGSFGQVWQVQCKHTQQIYALKVLKKKDLAAHKQVTHVHTNTYTERKILANIDHPFLVSLRLAIQTKSKLFMVMDFFNGSALFCHLQNEKKFLEE